MISGANEQELELANARADIIMALDNTSTYESWLIIDTYIEKLEQELDKIKEIIELNSYSYGYQIKNEILEAENEQNKDR